MLFFPRVMLNVNRSLVDQRTNTSEKNEDEEKNNNKQRRNSV
mgnify:FL=1